MEKTVEKESSEKKIKNNLKIGFRDVTLNNMYVKTFLITDFPNHAVPGLIYKLTHGTFLFPDHKGTERVHVNFALHIKPAIVSFDWKMNMKMNRLQKSIESADTGKASDTPREEEVEALRAMEHLRDGSSMKAYAEVWLSVTISGNDRKTFRKSIRTFKHDMKVDGFKLNDLALEQHEALSCAWATGDNKILEKYHGRVMDMDALCAFYPFLDGTITNNMGCYIGHRTSDGTMVYKDFTLSPDDQNILVTGTTGGGKSLFLKVLTISMLLANMKGYIYDVDGEYYNLCKAVGGEWIDYTKSSGRFVDPTFIEPSIFHDINPEDLDPDTYAKVKETDAARYQEAMDSTLGTIGLLIDDFTIRKQNAAEYALMQMWEKAGIDEQDLSTWENYDKSKVGLKILYSYIKKNAESNDDSILHKEGAVGLQEDLWSYFEGRKKSIFKNADSGEWIKNSKLTVFHVASSVDNEADQKMGAVKIVMISNMVWRQVKRDLILGKQFSFAIYDELQRLIKNAYAKQSVYRDTTTGRKFNFQVALGFNDPSILFPENEGIWNNAKYNVLFSLKENTIRDIGEKGGMPEEVIEEWINLPQYGFIFRERTAKGEAFDVLRAEVPKSEIDRLGKTRGLRKTS